MACRRVDLSRTWTSLIMATPQTSTNSSKPAPSRHTRTRQRWLVFGCFTVLLAVMTGAAGWIGVTANKINDELASATALISQLQSQVKIDDVESAASTVVQIRLHTAAAKDAAGDPVWALASSIPVLGKNVTAISEVARSADDVAGLGLAPLVKVLGTLKWEKLLPSTEGADLAPLKAAAPNVSGAANAVRLSADRLNRIDASTLVPQVAEPLSAARAQLQEVSVTLTAAATASEIAPAMLGADSQRSYLLMVQNNAEVRASGGIPGALALMSFDKGKLTLGAQSSAGDMGVMNPPLVVDQPQQHIFSGRLGKFMQDVNLTPDFPTAATTAQAMWERKNGQRVDGVISIDPIALGYVLDATGPVRLQKPELVSLAGTGLPTELNGDNVVQTLLSDVYSEIQQPNLQDQYFAGVAQEVFVALSDGNSNPQELLRGLTRAADEGRVRVWSASADEQAIIARYPLGGSVVGPSVKPAEFGVYFNDGTGAKMDYYVKRTVQLVKECPADGYEQTTVRVTTTNAAPPDAATSLPPYVTGDGVFGVPPGSVQTNIVAYGPAQAQVETAKLDDQRTEFAPYFHGNRPVGVLAIRLAPGESKTVDFTFGKIVQHTEPNVVVTPTVQDVKDVTLPTETAACG